MKFPQLISIITFIACLVTALPAAFSQEDNTNPPAMLPVTPEIESAVTTAMKGCPPHGTKLHQRVNTNGVYTLTGDLFHNGQTNALIDNTNNIILCEWDEHQWKTQRAIGVAPIWKSPTFNPEDWLGRTISATKPFRFLSLQGFPILIFGSDPDKYGQEYTALLLDQQGQQILGWTSSYMSEPLIKDNYLITSDSSRRKAEWEETYYYKIQTNKLVLQASCGSTQPWSAERESPETYNARSHGNEYGITDDGLVDTNCDVYSVYIGGIPSDSISAKSFAKITFKLTGSIYSEANRKISNDEIPYINWKLTGLPRNLVDEGDVKIETHSQIKVIGSPEAVKLLSP